MITPQTTAMRGPSAWPAEYAKRRAYPSQLEQKYQCWRPETLGNVSQWGDGPGIYNLTDPAEPKGAQVPYITDMRGGRKLFPERKASISNIPFGGPFEDAQGKPIDYYLAKNGGTLRTRMFANEDIGGQNPYLRAEQHFSASYGIEPRPIITHPPAPSFNSRGETLSRLELM